MVDFVLYVILIDMVFLTVCVIFLSKFYRFGFGSASGFVAIWTILGFWLWIRIRGKLMRIRYSAINGNLIVIKLCGLFYFTA